MGGKSRLLRVEGPWEEQGREREILGEPVLSEVTADPKRVKAWGPCDGQAGRARRDSAGSRGGDSERQARDASETSPQGALEIESAFPCTGSRFLPTASGVSVAQTDFTAVRISYPRPMPVLSGLREGPPWVPLAFPSWQTDGHP